MLSNSLFVKFWPFMKVLQIFAAFPIQKDSESLSGYKAMNSSIFLIVIAAVYIPALAFYFLSTYYVLLWNDIPFDEGLGVLFRYDESLLDVISYSIVLIAAVANLFIIFANFQIKDNLVFLLDAFQSVNIQKAKKLPNKTLLCFLCPFAIFTVLLVAFGGVRSIDERYQIGMVSIKDVLNATVKIK